MIIIHDRSTRPPLWHRALQSRFTTRGEHPIQSRRFLGSESTKSRQPEFANRRRNMEKTAHPWLDCVAYPAFESAMSGLERCTMCPRCPMRPPIAILGLQTAILDGSTGKGGVPRRCKHPYDEQRITVTARTSVSDWHDPGWYCSLYDL